MIKKAIIFDLFGTLLQIEKKRNPYLMLLESFKNETKSRDKLAQDIIMNDLSLEEIIDIYDLTMTEKDILYFRDALKTEIDSTNPVEDCYRALNYAKQKGYKLYLLSNLALPYTELYYEYNIDYYINKEFFSCIEKDKKPNPSFFYKPINHSKLNVDDFVMIGDSLKSDKVGAETIGMDFILKTKEDNIFDLVKENL
jgi:putative hydrolase of the HAD superfamily